MILALDPHGDDGVIFAAFTLQRLTKPTVCVVYDSYVQPARGIPGCDWAIRRSETWTALGQLNPTSEAIFLGFRDDDPPIDPQKLADVLVSQFPGVTECYAPALEIGGHEQHNIVGAAAALAFGKVRYYSTYTRTHGKSRRGKEVLPLAEEIQLKLRALACFKSQMQPDPRLGCAEWFYGTDLKEYVIP